MSKCYSVFDFTLPIHEFRLDDWEEKKKYIMELLPSDKECKPVEFDLTTETINTNYWSKDAYAPKYESLPELFRPELDELMKRECCEGWYTQGLPWYEIADKGQYHGMHTHGTTGFVAVCYVNYDKYEHDPINFIAPFHDPVSGGQLSYTPNLEEGMLIFFKALLIHATTPNRSNERRICISFNVELTGNCKVSYTPKEQKEHIEGH